MIVPCFKRDLQITTFKLFLPCLVEIQKIDLVLKDERGVLLGVSIVS